jgi:7-carboxy-7-deazaguanine synthase
MDLKCPGSGEQRRNLWSNLEHLGPRDEIKFVLADRRDYEWARATIRERDLAARAGLLLSPVHGLLKPAELAAWMREDRLPARLNLQLHKLVWPDATRGV